MLKKYSDFYLFLLSALCFILTYSSTSTAISPDLDAGYVYALNYFFANHYIIGKQIIFTYGPLGFTEFAQPMGHNLIIAEILNSIISFLLIFYFLKLVLQLRITEKFLSKIIAFVLAAIFFLFVTTEYKLFFLIITWLLLIKDQDKPYLSIYLPFAVIAATIALLIKPAEGILCYSALFVYGIQAIIFQDRKTIVSIIGYGIVSYIALWLLCNNTFSGIINYLIISSQFCAGNSSAMSIYAPNKWSVLLLSFFFFLVVGKLLYPTDEPDKTGFRAFIIFILPLLIWFKYSLTREDGHVDYLIKLFLFMILYLLPLVIDLKQLVRIALIAAFSFIFLTFNFVRIGQTYKPTIHWHGLSDFYYKIIHFPENKLALEKQSEQNLASEKLPEKILHLINHQSVDTYPWNTTLIAANNLQWQSRPIFQSYITYTPYLDNINAHFFQQKHGADFILWDSHNWMGNILTSIDNRYELNNEPLTIYQIFTWYKPIYTENDYTLFQLQTHPQLTTPTIIQQSQTTWNTWTNIPNSNAIIIRVNISIHRTFLGWLKKLFYKEDAINIDYQLDNHQIITYRLPIDNAQNGVWIKPYALTMGELFNNGTINKKPSAQINAIRLTYTNDDYFEHKIKLEWIGINSIG